MIYAFTILHQFIPFNNKLLKSQKRWGVRVWYDIFLARVNLKNIQVLIYNEFAGVAKHVRWLVKLKQAPEMTSTSDAPDFQAVASDSNVGPSLPAGWIWTDIQGT
jgi:hypothetical protein